MRKDARSCTVVTFLFIQFLCWPLLLLCSVILLYIFTVLMLLKRIVFPTVGQNVYLILLVFSLHIRFFLFWHLFVVGKWHGFWRLDQIRLPSSSQKKTQHGVIKISPKLQTSPFTVTLQRQKTLVFSNSTEAVLKSQEEL